MHLNHFVALAAVVPISTHIATLHGITAITRVWLEGDAAECRLCQTCVAKDDVCLVQTTDVVAPGEAASYDSNGAHVAPLRAGIDHDTLADQTPLRWADRQQGQA